MLWEKAVPITPVLVAADIRIAVRTTRGRKLGLVILLAVFITTRPTIWLIADNDHLNAVVLIVPL